MNKNGYDGAKATAFTDPNRTARGDTHGSLRLVGWHEFKALIGRPGDRSADDPNGLIPTGRRDSDIPRVSLHPIEPVIWTGNFGKGTRNRRLMVHRLELTHWRC